jgi:hypothetical protein
MLACDAAPGCDSFSYNPAQLKCFLKSGAARRTCRAAETVCVSARGKPYSCGVWQTYFKSPPGAAGAVPLLPQAAPPAPPTAKAAGAGQAPGGRAASVQLVEAFNQQP